MKVLSVSEHWMVAAGLQFKTAKSNITPVIVNVNIFACSPGTSGWKINVSMIGTGNSHQPVISISGRVLFPKHPSQGIFQDQSFG